MSGDLAFQLSKILWGLAMPSSALTLILAGGTALAWGRRRRLGLALVSAVSACLVLVGLVPVGTMLARPLENRFPQPALPRHIDGIVVLGGAVDPTLTAERGRPALNAFAERMTAFTGLARRHPRARLVFTGGNGGLTPGPITEAEVARRLFDELGLDTRRMLFENASRNTYENALFTKRLADPRPGETWLLVTSAVHMPRSVGVFRRVGWDVVPWPVAYKTGRHFDLVAAAGLSPMLGVLDLAVHEWFGLLAYRLMGWTDDLLPGPTS
jgi:uncharacterized SAM-binding protein YcdF (DUF218 family)